MNDDWVKSGMSGMSGGGKRGIQAKTCSYSVFEFTGPWDIRVNDIVIDQGINKSMP